MDGLTGGANEIRDSNLIGGRWVAAHAARTFDVLDPANGERANGLSRGCSSLELSYAPCIAQ